MGPELKGLHVLQISLEIPYKRRECYPDLSFNKCSLNPLVDRLITSHNSYWILESVYNLLLPNELY